MSSSDTPGPYVGRIDQLNPKFDCSAEQRSRGGRIRGRARDARTGDPHCAKTDAANVDVTADGKRRFGGGHRCHSIGAVVITGVSFEIWRGEIFGLAGLIGAGRTEVARAIFGVKSAPLALQTSLIANPATGVLVGAWGRSIKKCPHK